MPQSLSRILVHLIFSTKDRSLEQEEHHKRMSFQDEYRKFLQRYQVAFDERYVWD